jgi:hypothetical protein
MAMYSKFVLKKKYCQVLEKNTAQEVHAFAYRQDIDLPRHVFRLVAQCSLQTVRMEYNFCILAFLSKNFTFGLRWERIPKWTRRQRAWRHAALQRRRGSWRRSMTRRHHRHSKSPRKIARRQKSQHRCITARRRAWRRAVIQQRRGF